MKMLAYHGISLFSKIESRFFFNDPRTHTAIELDSYDALMFRDQFRALPIHGGCVLEAAFFKARNHDGTVAGRGVRIIQDYSVGHKDGTLVDVYDIALPEGVKTLALKIMLSHYGRPYDFRGLLGFLLRRHTENPKADFCSELFCMGFKEARHGENWIAGREPWQMSPAMVCWNEKLAIFTEQRKTGANGGKTLWKRSVPIFDWTAFAPHDNPASA